MSKNITEVSFKNLNKVTMPIEMAKDLAKAIEDDYQKQFAGGKQFVETDFDKYNGTKLKCKFAVVQKTNGMIAIKNIQLCPFGVTLQFENNEEISISDDHFTAKFKSLK